MPRIKRKVNTVKTARADTLQTVDTEEEEFAENKDDVTRIIKKYYDKIANPLSGIRAKCVECMGGQVKSVTDCPSSPESKMPCALWPFRMGKNTMDGRFGVSKPFPSKKKVSKKPVKDRRTK